MRCKNCGTENEDFVRYCNNCACLLQEEEKVIRSNKGNNGLPYEYCFDDSNAYGKFDVRNDCLDISYSPSGLSKKKKYLINYNDIEEMEVVVAALPVAVKDLYITIKDSDRMHFYISKSTVDSWIKLSDYINKHRGNVTKGVVKKENEEEPVETTIPKRKSSKTASVVWFIVAVIIFIFAIGGCVKTFSKKPYVRVDHTEEAAVLARQCYNTNIYNGSPYNSITISCEARNNGNRLYYCKGFDSSTYIEFHTVVSCDNDECHYDQCFIKKASDYNY